MDPAVIFAVIGYRIPGFLELTLPLAFFLAILLTFGRLYVENEMSVLKACGISEGQLLGYTLIMGAVLAVLVGWLSLYGSPAGAAKAETILKAQKEMTELDKVSPKKFYTLGGDKGVTYAERINDDRELEDVFLAITAGSAETFDSRLVVVVAESGKQQRSKDGEDRYLVLDSGYRFEGIPGNHNYQITYFEEYAIRTADLWSSNEAELRATLQWRLSTPFMVLVVVIMAVPLSRTNPRQGRFAKLLPAIMLYFAYLLSLNAIRGNIESGDYPAGLTLIPVHLLFLLLGFFLVNSERFRIFQRIVALRRMKFS